jgi:hypothetical protein
MDPNMTAKAINSHFVPPCLAQSICVQSWHCDIVEGDAAI